MMLKLVGEQAVMNTRRVHVSAFRLLVVNEPVPMDQYFIGLC